MAAILKYFAPGNCYDVVFVNFNFFDEKCFPVVLSKVLSFQIILGAVMVKVPQIVKMIMSGSAEGLSMLAIVLELTALTLTGAYNFAKEFPFSTYGETAFLGIQTFVIWMLVFHYNGKSVFGGVMAAVYAVVLYTFLSGLVPIEMLTFLQSTTIPVLIVSRMSQIINTYRLGSTGQLSFITYLLLWGGAIARVFTTIQETSDPLMLIQYCCTVILNTIIVAQFLIYWSADKKKEQ